MTKIYSVQVRATELKGERDWGVARVWRTSVEARRLALEQGQALKYKEMREVDLNRIKCSERLMKHIFDDILVCRASHTRLEVSGAGAPVTVPGCLCVVSSGAGRHFSKLGRCGLCKTALPGVTGADACNGASAGFPSNAAALQLVRDANTIHGPLLEYLKIPAHHRHKDPNCHATNECSATPTWDCESVAHGTKGRSCYGALYQEDHSDDLELCTCGHVLKRSIIPSGGHHNFFPVGKRVCSVTVHAVPIPDHGRDAHVIYSVMHGIITHHFASLVSSYVEPVVGIYWPPTGGSTGVSRFWEGYPAGAHFATSGHVTTLASYVAAHDVRRGTVKLRAQKLICLCKQVTRAVLSIHRFGIVHCGISPTTVMIGISIESPQVSVAVSADSATVDMAYNFSAHVHVSAAPRLTLACFNKAHRHTRATAIGRCADAGCAVREMRAREMEGHVCAAADVHDIGQTMAFVAGRWLDDAEDGMPDAVAAACKGARQQIKAMTDAPGECCLVQASAAFEDLHSDLCLLE